MIEPEPPATDRAAQPWPAPPGRWLAPAYP